MKKNQQRYERIFSGDNWFTINGNKAPSQIPDNFDLQTWMEKIKKKFQYIAKQFKKVGC